MQLQIRKESPVSELNFGSVRRPIQCEGTERGHRRMAEVAASGSVNPQFGIQDLLPPWAASLLPGWG
jgi:hypothetical protein